MNLHFNIKSHTFSTIISLKGKIMSDTDIEALSMEIKKLISDKKTNLIFNLTELSYLNSSGINLFMKTLTASRINNGDLIFYGVNGNVSNLFKITKLSEIYTIYSSENDAVNHFKNK